MARYNEMTTNRNTVSFNPLKSIFNQSFLLHQSLFTLPSVGIAALALTIFTGCSSSPSEEVMVSTHTVPNNTGELYYEIYGSGKPILFLTGGPGNSGEYFIPVAKRVSARYQSILLNQRGTGRSTVTEYSPETINLIEAINDLELLRKHLKLNEWTVLGHSWGGMLGIAYASKHPEVVSDLILIAPGGMTMDFEEFEQIIMGRLTEEDMETINYWQDPERSASDPHGAMIEMMKAQQPGYFVAREKGKEFIASLNTDNFSVPTYQYMWGNLMATKYDLTESLRVFKNPTLLLLASGDPGLSGGLAIKNSLPQSEVVIIEDSGHYPFIEQPEAFYAALFAFLD